MKSKMILKNTLKVFLSLTLLSTVANVSYAQDFTEEVDTVYNSKKDIDVDGSWENADQPREKTSEEILADAQKKAEKRNVKDIARKVERLKIPPKQAKKLENKQKKYLTNRISEIFTSTDEGTGTDNEDTVEVKQSSQVKVVEAVPTIQEQVKPVKYNNILKGKTKIAPFFGMAAYKGKGINLESDVNAGLSVESMINDIFAVGANINYTTMEITANPNKYSPYSNYQYHGGKQNLEYSKLSIGLHSKVFFSTKSRIKPYFGAGVNYNRVSLKYVGSNGSVGYYTYNPVVPYSNYQTVNNGQFGVAPNSEVSSSYFSGTLFGGTEINFSDSVSFDLGIKYERSLNSGVDENSYFANQLEKDLNNLEKRIEDSDIFIVNGGIIIHF